MSRNVFPCTSLDLAIPGRGWEGRGGLGPRGLGGAGGSKASPEQVLSRVCLRPRGLDTLGRRRRRIRTQMTHSDWSQFPGGSLPGPDIALLFGPPAPCCCRCVAQNFGFLATQNPPPPHQSRPLALFASSSIWLADFETRP